MTSHTEEDARYGLLTEIHRLVDSRSTDSLTDDLASHYSALSDDDSRRGEAREAAMLFCVAEGHLEEGDADEALQSATDALAIFQQLGDAVGTVDALRLVVGAHRLRDTNAALSVAEAELRKFQESGDERGVSSMRVAIAEVHLMRSRNEEALQMLAEALFSFQRLNDPKMQANVQLSLANAYVLSDRGQDAVNTANDAREAFQSLGDKKGEAKACHLQALAHVLTDTPKDGLLSANRALVLARELEDTKLEVVIMTTVSDLELERENPREAYRIAAQALSLSRRTAYWRGEALSLDKIVRAQVELGERAEALREAKNGVLQCQRSGDMRTEASAIGALITALLANHEREKALSSGWDAMELLKKTGETSTYARSLLVVALLHLVNAQDAWAKQSALRAQEIYQKLGDRRGEGLVQYVLLHVLQEHSLDDALAAGTQAQAIWKDIGDKRWIASTWMALCRVHRLKGDAKAEVTTAKRAQWIYDEKGDAKGSANALLTIAQVHLGTKVHNKAFTAANESLGILKKAGYDRSRSVALHMVASIHLDLDEFDEVLKLATEARSVCKHTEYKKGEGHALHLLTSALLSKLFQAASKLEAYVKRETVEWVEEGELNYGDKGQSRKSQLQYEIPDTKYKKFEAMEKTVTEIAERALATAKEASAAADMADDKELYAAVLHCLGQVQLMTKKPDDALKSANAAVELGREGEDTYRQSISLILSAEALYMLHKPGEALEAAETGLKLARKNGDSATEAYGNKVITLVLGEPAKDTEAQTSAEAEAEEDAVEEWQGLDPEMVRERVRDEVMQTVGIEDIVDDVPLMDTGMDSLSSVEFRNSLAREFQMNLSSTLVFDFPSVKALTDHLTEQSKTAAPASMRQTQKAVTGDGSKKDKPSAGASSKPTSRSGADVKVVRPCIAGTWDNWTVHEMFFDMKHYTFEVEIGSNGWESFQILSDGDWKRCLYPQDKDATPHAPSPICGPDDDGHGLNWTVGQHVKDMGGEGVKYQIRLALDATGGAEKLDWIRLGSIVPQHDPAEANRPWIIGTWDSWQSKTPMRFDSDLQAWSFRLTVGKNGWESFQILLRGEWKRCLYPDTRDGCPHMEHAICGPEGSEVAHGKNWTVGRHPLDEGGKGVAYDIRLFFRSGNVPERVTWVRL